MSTARRVIWNIRQNQSVKFETGRSLDRRGEEENPKRRSDMRQRISLTMPCEETVFARRLPLLRPIGFVEIDSGVEAGLLIGEHLGDVGNLPDVI